MFEMSRNELKAKKPTDDVIYLQLYFHITIDIPRAISKIIIRKNFTIS